MRPSILPALALLVSLSGCGGGYAASGAPMGGAVATADYGPGGYPAPAPPMEPMAMEAREEAMDEGYAMEAEAPTRAPAPAFAKQAPAPAPTGSAPAPQGQPAGSSSPKVAAEDARRAPILIYRADFTMSVFEVAKSLDAVERLAVDAGGYLARRDDNSITVRVPAAKFQDVVVSLEKVGDVLHRNVVSEDVTAEFRDLEVQLQNLLALRSRFEKLLEKAQKVEEALQIERELGRITGEIERIKGRLKLLADLAQYSTITVRFEPRASSTVQEGPFVLPLPWLGNLGLRRLMSL